MLSCSKSCWSESCVVAVDVAASQTDESIPDYEKRANSCPAERLVPDAKLGSFVRRNGPHYYQKKVVQFALARAVRPGIVVGQLQNRGELSFQQFRKLLEKVRGHVVGEAITDGWSNA